MSFDLNEPPATIEETGMPQQAALVVPQPHKPHSVATTYPSNLFQAGEGLQLHGTLNNNSFMHASLGSGFQPFERNKDPLNTEVPIFAEVLDHGATGPESIQDLECKEAEETTLAITPQESSIVVPQTQQPLNHVLPTYPSNLLLTGEGSQMQGMLNNNGFHASEVERMKEDLRKKDENIAELQRNIGVMEQNYADVNRRIGVLEEHLRDANESLRKKEAELAILQHRFEVIERNYDANKRIGEEQLSAANESLQKKEEELTALKHSFGVTNQNYAGSRKRIRVLEDQLSTVNESLQKKEEELTALKHNFGDIEQNYAGATKRIGVPANLLSSTANDLLKVEVQKAQSIFEASLKDLRR